MFSYDIVFTEHIFENGIDFFSFFTFDLDLEGHPTNGFEQGLCFLVACRVSFEVVKSACFHMTSFL